MPAPSARRVDPWLLVAILCWAGFLLLGVVVNEQGSFAIDAPVIAAVQAVPLPTEIWRVITEAGGAILVPIGIGLVLVLVARREYRLAIVVAIALVGATLLTDHVKDVIARPRPPGDPLAPAKGYSFPSGHTLLSTVTYGLIALVVWRSHLPIAVRRGVLVGVVVLVLLIGLSRIALGVHYPSDVLGGWLGGLAIVATVAAATRPSPPARRVPAADRTSVGTGHPPNSS